MLLIYFYNTSKILSIERIQCLIMHHQLNISWNSEHLQCPVICFNYATLWSIINIIQQQQQKSVSK